LRLFSFGGYGLALAALALVVFGAYDSYPSKPPNFKSANAATTSVQNRQISNPPTPLPT